MATQVYEETLEVEIGVLEAASSDSDRGSAFPYPELRDTGTRRKATFRVAVLENNVLKATMVPALGGRILGLLDKRTGVEIFERRPLLSPEKGGPRGFHLPDGLQVHVGEAFRPNTMGPVDFLLDEPEDEDAPGAVWFAERVLGTGLSFHVRYSLAPDSACIELEVRALNRSLRPQTYSAWLGAFSGGTAFECSEGVAVYDNSQKAGLAVLGDRATFDGAGYFNGTLTMSRFEPGVGEWLGPRQLDGWAVRIVPFSGLASLGGFGVGAALAVEEDSVAVQAVGKLPGAKLVVLCEGGQTVEAPLNADLGETVRISTAGLPGPPVVLAVKDAAKDEVVRWERGAPLGHPQRRAARAGSSTMAALRRSQLGEAEGRERSYFEGLDAMESGGEAETLLKRALVVPGLRGAANVALAMCSLRRADWREAASRFEEALLFNGEDHLCWWMKGLADRLAGEADADGPELPNAHYLAPLEPVLRAEAFLSQPVSADSPILKPVAEDVEAAVDVACLLIDAGLFEQAARFLNEVLRHRDEPRLRLLTAYVCVAGRQMKAEAAVHLTAAERLARTSRAWQPTELRAARELGEVLPGSLWSDG